MNKRCLLQLSFFSGKLNISIFSVLALFLFVLADFSVFTAILVSCILIHELSHLITMKICKGKVKKINVYPFGIDIVSDIHTLSYTKELIIVLSGGVANLVCALTAQLVFGWGYSTEMCFFIFANTLLGVGNLVPLPVFDGGRAVHIIIERFFLPDTAYTLRKWTDGLSFLLFFAFSVLFMLFTKCNFTAVMCVAYTALAAIIYEKLVAKDCYRGKL